VDFRLNVFFGKSGAKVQVASFGSNFGKKIHIAGSASGTAAFW
jgi:hypothetical protein